MSRNTMLALVALLLVALVGGAGAFWGYKKYRQKQNQEFLYEGSMGTPREGFDVDAFKAAVLDDAVMDAAVKEHQLVSVWSLADEDAAKKRLREKFTVRVSDGVVKVRYQDKNQDLAKVLLESIVKSYYVKANAGGKSAPLPAPASQ